MGFEKKKNPLFWFKQREERKKNKLVKGFKIKVWNSCMETISMKLWYGILVWKSLIV